MTFTCQHCSKTIHVSAGDSGLRPTSSQQGGAKVVVDFAAFRDLCYLIKSKPEAESFHQAMSDLPSSLAKYGSLTAKQWKLFCAAHKQAMGTWPPKPEDMTVSADPGLKLPEDPEEIPF